MAMLILNTLDPPRVCIASFPPELPLFPHFPPFIVAPLQIPRFPCMSRHFLSFPRHGPFISFQFPLHFPCNSPSFPVISLLHLPSLLSVLSLRFPFIPLHFLFLSPSIPFQFPFVLHFPLISCHFCFLSPAFPCISLDFTVISPHCSAFPHMSPALPLQFPIHFPSLPLHGSFISRSYFPFRQEEAEDSRPAESRQGDTGSQKTIFRGTPSDFRTVRGPKPYVSEVSRGGEKGGRGLPLSFRAEHCRRISDLEGSFCQVPKNCDFQRFQVCKPIFQE